MYVDHVSLQLITQPRIKKTKIVVKNDIKMATKLWTARKLTFN